MINIEKYKKLILTALCILLILLVAYVFIKYVLSIFLPFLISFVTVCVAKKGIGKISKKTKIPSGVVVFFLSFIILALIVAFCVGFIDGIQALIEGAKSELAKENNIFTILIGKIRELEKKLPFLKKLDNENGGIIAIIAELTKELVKKCSLEITTFVTVIPKVVLTSLVTVISLFYFAKDYDRINILAKKKLPKKAYNVSVFLKNNAINILGKYFKSYLLLFFITFAQLLSGFLILNVKSPLPIALLISLLDILPILGSSIILLVWAIVMLLYGNLFLGIGLIFMAVTIYIVRQIVEPKILSKQMDVHPLITLAFIYAGFKISGVLGMIFAPLIPFILKPIIVLIKKSKNTVDNKNKLW